MKIDQERSMPMKPDLYALILPWLEKKYGTRVRQCQINKWRYIAIANCVALTTEGAEVRLRNRGLPVLGTDNLKVLKAADPDFLLNLEREIAVHLRRKAQAEWGKLPANER